VKRASFALFATLALGGHALGGAAHAEMAANARPLLAEGLDFSLPAQAPAQSLASIDITAFRLSPEASGAAAGEKPPLPIREAGGPRPAWTDHVPRSESAYPTFGRQVGRIKWESLGVLGYFTLVNSPKFFRDTRPLHFKNEGWFGKSTANLGVDKLTHAFDSYILAEALHARLHDRTHASGGDALTAALLATGAMFYSELSDGIESDSGISLQDIAMNTAGATFSLLRNTVPGLREKLDFRLLLIPNSNIYSRTGKRHYAQQRYLMALQLAGFERFRETPLRLVELHAGYYASDFTNQDIARGKTPRRHLFVGVGINLRELLFRSPRSRAARIAGVGLDYLQVPYTAAHWD